MCSEDRTGNPEIEGNRWLPRSIAGAGGSEGNGAGESKGFGQTSAEN
jgi:hypothetical protein